jgi:two-component system, chemotaxis family, protein-glutamate methylesterase/glutaminase
MANRKKVLIVDDSAIYRNLIQKAIGNETDIEIVGSVGSGKEALQKIGMLKPDVVTLDVEMPGMDGLETLNRIQDEAAKSPALSNVGVIMVSAFTRKGAEITIQALEAGAFDFVAKPETGSVEESMEILRRQLLVKIRHHAISSLRKQSVRRGIGKEGKVTMGEAAHLRPAAKAPMAKPHRVKRTKTVRAVLIGVSTGGPKALVKMLPQLCLKISLPIMIVQHMPPTFTKSLADTLNSRCRHTVKEIGGEETVASNTVYLAPGGKHMLLMKSGAAAGPEQVLVNEQPPVNGFRPSVDVLFRSAASVYGGDVVAVILTGMGSDGTRGLGTLKRNGAYTIAQDEDTSVVWGMPQSAIEAGHIDEVLPLEQIAEAVEKVANIG